jgi:hypothetical protein
MSQLSGNYVKQTSMGTYQGTPLSAIWPITWIAPASASPVTFYFAGNAANNDLLATGDNVYTDSLVVIAGYPVYITLTPTGTTTFDSTGGTLNYDVAVINTSSSSQTIDVWVDVYLPTGGLFGPVVGPVQNFTMAPLLTISRSRTLTIPAGAPVGTYSLNAYIGTYTPPSSPIFSEDHFNFTKTSHDDSEPGLSAWFVDAGEPFSPLADLDEIAEEYLLCQSYPNPFNPSTVLSYQLQVASSVSLHVYDIQGSLVAELINGWRDVGSYEVTFDASHLASGIYIYRLQAGQHTASGKMVLMK